MIPGQPNPNPDLNGQGGTASGGQPQGTPPPAPSKFEELKQKKGFKSEEDLAKSYEEVEKSKSRFETIHGKTKQQLESQGFTIDDNGDIKPMGGVPQAQPQYPQQGQPYQQPIPQETVYDPYTGQQITDPIALQLAKMPVGMREAYIFNAMQEQREKQSTLSYQAEAETLSKSEAKGFEDDVKEVMRQLPLAQRANKKSWEDALLRVKGMKYDEALKNAQQQGVDNFINKEGNQLPSGSGGSGAGVALTPDQEQTFAYYQKHMPGTFKDSAHFLRNTRPDGGRCVKIYTLLQQLERDTYQQTM